jgi:hypothetical protein
MLSVILGLKGTYFIALAVFSLFSLRSSFLLFSKVEAKVTSHLHWWGNIKLCETELIEMFILEVYTARSTCCHLAVLEESVVIVRYNYLMEQFAGGNFAGGSLKDRVPPYCFGGGPV